MELTTECFANRASFATDFAGQLCVDALALLSAPANGMNLVLTDCGSRAWTLWVVHGSGASEFRHRSGQGDGSTAVALLRLGASDSVKRQNLVRCTPLNTFAAIG
jgi:hypothetical protein